MKLIDYFMPIMFTVMLAGCRQTAPEGQKGFPENFSSLTDTEKVKFVMDNASPDSVARFICDAALGKVVEGKIDTLPVASAYAYQHYADSLLVQFSGEFDDYSASLPLAEKMRIYYMAGTHDPSRLGYELGLEYVDQIRGRRMSTAEIEREIKAFREACGEDSATYLRFIKGFKTVLKLDHGKDLPEEVYNAFIKY